MCLELKNKNERAKVAQEDITVYKRLRVRKGIKLGNHGKAFTAVIDEKPCSGAISEFEGKTFFCTDNDNLNGNDCPNKFGFKNSWEFDSVVKNMVIDGIDIEESVVYVTPYQDFRVEIGNTYTSELKKNGYEVNEGLHSFSTLQEARQDGDSEGEDVHVECIIPKGSKYYIGLFGGGVSYASDTLTYVRIVDKEEE